ncbi:unnamed protein product [Didymodactylos carnosus]|uniref:Uncharacterized protein n=1 Tax=Didymodactylos carnosus TaxID=1234261 RepID=A0A813SYK2_9BILA|nr:unnamed protein product [Didymodactylos carnosus]CAF0946049.1 unnamed protein product [Didymodactylos carnosus]CAF3591898.1 unnamed protein product [Didymodactylos carnosus]CAF3720682.1 unnamed protein product [Didymodactylos carnosus]
MSTTAKNYNGYNSFLDKYRTNLNTKGNSNSGQQSGYNSQRPHYVSTQQQSPQYGSNGYDTSTLRASGNVINDERFGNEILARAGPSSQYQHPEYRTHEVIAPEGRIENLDVQHDQDPLRVVKPGSQDVHYKQHVNVRFLEPPLPADPAPIIIKERQAPAPPPQPPIVVRQRPPTPRTPPPLIIRGIPPTPPPQQQPQIIEKIIPAPPPPPRQVIVERLPPPPPKPRQVIYEKWLPYQETKERPVIVEKAQPCEILRPPKNVIIEYERPRAHHEQIITDEGVFRADPATHHATSTVGEVRVVDKITDLPINYSKYLTNRSRPPSAPSRSTSSPNLAQSHQIQQIQPQFNQTEPGSQYRTTTYNYPGAYTTTYRSSYTYNNPNRNFMSEQRGGGNDGSRSAAYSKYV